MKKFRFTLVLIIACLLLVGLLTACGGNNNNSSTPSNNIRNLLIGESATNCSNALSCSYDYGEDISSIKNLKFFFEYSNNSKQELTADQVKKVQFSLTLSDDTKITTIDSNLSLDVGSYVVTCTYETHIATINLTILPIDADSSEYSFEVKNASNGTIAESLKFGSSIIGDTMTSPYTISIKKGSEYINKTQLAEIYYITPAEYTEYSALTNASDKKEFLTAHEIVTKNDETVNRMITYNRDSKTDTEFYAYLNDFNLKPGTYYLFANINASGNYNSFYVEPSASSRITIVKGDFSLNEIVVTNLGSKVSISDIHVRPSFSYDDSYMVNDIQTNILGDISLGEIFEYKYSVNGIPCTNEQNLYVDMQGAHNLLTSYGKFAFADPSLMVNSNSGVNEDGNVKVDIIFVLNDSFSDYYESLDTFEVDLTITKGRVAQPYVSDNVNLEFEYYFGEEWNLVYSPSNTYGYLYEYNPLLCQLANDSDKLVASNVGHYQCQIELVDSANYTWVEETVTGRNYGGPTRTFNWEIKKRGNIALDYTLKYNGEDIENVYDAVITYDRANPPQSMEIEITLGVENEPYYRYVNNRTFIYSIECYGVTATLASISTNNTNTITITGISGLTNPHDYLVVTISCDEDDCFEDYEQQLPSIEFIPGELTQEEKDTILAAIPNTTYDNISYSTTTAITIIKDDDQYKISSNDLPDETVNSLGEFVLYYSYPKDYNLVTGKVEFGNNAYYVIPWIDDVSFPSNIDDSITVIQFYFRFEPYNKFIEQIEIYATTELYSME